MTTPSWLGMRDADLSPNERIERDTASATLRAEHEQALALGEATARLPDAATPPWQDRSTAPRRVPTWVPVLALAATALVVVNLPSDAPMRARGTVTGGTPIVLRAVAEGPAGLRPLAAGDIVQADETVLFEAQVGASGRLEISEDDAVLWPIDKNWHVDAGRHTMGGSQPKAWRSPAPGTHTYTATLCEPDAACVHTSLDLTWQR